MANLLIVVILMLTSLMISIPNSSAREEEPCDDLEWFKNIINGEVKVAKLHFFVQDIASGENKTVYEVTRSSISSTSSTTFGQVLVVDDLLTVGPQKDSEEVGRLQGMVTSADLEIYSFTVNINFVFTYGKYNGSTLSVLGRNPILSPEREVPVVGGTGIFRMARGFAITSTYSSGVLEYTIYVSYL